MLIRMVLLIFKIGNKLSKMIVKIFIIVILVFYIYYLTDMHVNYIKDIIYKR